MSDRRDHFTTRADPWDMLVTIMEQRKRRELEPTLNFLRDARASSRTIARHRRRPGRASSMLGFRRASRHGSTRCWRCRARPS
jgi:DNA-binding transcriptional regulator GbsR (MarR family)